MIKGCLKKLTRQINLRNILFLLLIVFVSSANAQMTGKPDPDSREARQKQKEKDRKEKEKRERKEKEKKDKEKAIRDKEKAKKTQGKKATSAVRPGKTEKRDTFNIVHQLIAQRKYKKASSLLDAYHKSHPSDLNSIWLHAQTQLWLGNFKKSDRLYKSAIQLQPTNDYLKLNYIHSSLEMGRSDSAKDYLEKMEKAGSEYPDMSFLHAQLYYWAGDYDQASAYINKAMELDEKNTAARDLSDQIIAARAPKISLNSGYLSDNQPYTAVISALKFEETFNRLLSLYVEGDEYHLIDPGTSDAPWIKAGDKMSFPRAGLQVSAGAGVFKFPVKNQTGVSGNLDITKKISPSFDVEVVGEEVPYLDTKSSIDTNITVAKFTGKLYWHRNRWIGQAAFIDNLYAGNAYVYSAFAWVMAPVATFSHGQFMLGYSTSYSNSNVNSYSPDKSLSDIIAAGNSTVSGLYNPYFTPSNLTVNAALASLNIEASKKIGLNFNADIGFGSINNPYLYLDKTANKVVRGAQVESFVPGDFTFTFNYHIDKTLLISAKYIYRSTYFFTSNFAGIGIEKSFWRSREIQHGKSKKSAFMDKVNGIEQEIQWLYGSKNAEDLRNSVSKIRTELVALRNEQMKSKNTTEILPNGSASRLLQNRYESLNEMISEIDAVDLSDSGETKRNLKQWLVDKLYELTSISYDDSYEEP